AAISHRPGSRPLYRPSSGILRLSPPPSGNCADKGASASASSSPPVCTLVSRMTSKSSLPPLLVGFHHAVDNSTTVVRAPLSPYALLGRVVAAASRAASAVAGPDRTA